MHENSERIGISGGTFDPIHYGHLIVAEEIRESMKLDRVVFIPTGNPPHKVSSRVTGAEHRFGMVQCAIRSNPFFEASRIEIERAGLTYTIDTLEQLMSVYKENTRLFFITGADVIPELLTWKDYRRLFSLCEFIAVLRPGYKKDEFMRKIEVLKSEYEAKIYTVNAPLIGISSTTIRERVKDGKSIKYLVPEGVEEYIRSNGLYKQEKR